MYSEGANQTKNEMTDKLKSWNNIQYQQRKTNSSVVTSNTNTTFNTYPHWTSNTFESAADLPQTFNHQTPLPPSWPWFGTPNTQPRTRDHTSWSFNSNNHWSPLESFPKSSTSTSHYSPTSQYIANPMSTTFYQSQGTSFPTNSAAMTSGMVPKSRFGTTFQTESESTAQRYGLTNSTNFAQSGGCVAFQERQNHEYEYNALNQRISPIGQESAFQPYQKASTRNASSGFAPSHSYESIPKTTTTSPYVNYNYEHTKRSTNEVMIAEPKKQKHLQACLQGDKENAASLENNEIRKKTLKPSSDSGDDFSCVICQDNKKDTVLMPCRHLCVCQKCCNSIELCPLCRKKVKESMTVFT